MASVATVPPAAGMTAITATVVAAVMAAVAAVTVMWVVGASAAVHHGNAIVAIDRVTMAVVSSEDAFCVCAASA